MRGKMTGHRDLKLRHLPLAALGLAVTSVASMILLLPFAWLSRVDFGTDDGFTTTLGTVADTLSVSAVTYILGVPAILLSLCWTLGSPRYVTDDVPRLIWRNRERLIRGLLRTTAVPLVLVCIYWVMIQRVPMKLDPLGVWLILTMIAARFTITDAYRVYRDDMTVLDTFGSLMPQKMRERTETHRGRTRKIMSKVPLFTWGDGVLIIPLIQAGVVVVAAALGVSALLAGRSSEAEDQTWMYGFLVCLMLSLFLWGFLFRLMDAWKPWGEKGKLSIVRNGRGEKRQHEDGSVGEETDPDDSDDRGRKTP